MSRNIITLIIDIKNGYILTYLLCVCLEKLLYIHGILPVCVSEAEHDFFEHSIRPCLPSTSTESWMDLVKAEVGTSKDKLDLVDLNLVIESVVRVIC